MLYLQTNVLPRCPSPFCNTKMDACLRPLSSVNVQNSSLESSHAITRLGFLFHSPVSTHCTWKQLSCYASGESPSNTEYDCEPKPGSNKSARPKAKPGSNKSARPKARTQSSKDVASGNGKIGSADAFPSTIPRKPRRGRRSEAMAVEDYIRGSLERTFETIRQQKSDVLEDPENIMKDRVRGNSESKSSDDDDDDGEEEVKKDNEEEEDDEDDDDRVKNMVIEEESENWPVDADVGWGIRASEYFEQHPIKNVVGEDGYEIDWEGETEDYWVQEINCLEWENFAFHPSPLIVLVFERYNRASDNWKLLKELEEAIKVYWNAKNRLPPRAVKIDINIERDMAYALKVKECPQILFLRGHRVVYREKELRSADELVQMIAFFYYNAKKPAWIDDKALPRFRF
ncbi:thioredoxin-like fold domain-containing protein MRL7, chloroplastic [Arachis stenosperma]|uniref:thioredoxin-like fold domain-containing protein MRL7, chloroplastic n=1 Tax=Arachis stenosperma TaxID=217475 RepID=UPI0025AD40A7|nr:thioredoxin-like fold domain-containing protein MRL7, chloroplastic [Arachis stenosperma]